VPLVGLVAIHRRHLPRQPALAQARPRGFLRPFLALGGLQIRLNLVADPRYLLAGSAVELEPREVTRSGLSASRRR